MKFDFATDGNQMPTDMTISAASSRFQLNPISVLLAMICTSTNIAAAQNSGPLSIRRETLPNFVGDYQGMVQFAAAANGFRWAYRTRLGNEEFVVVDGVREKAFDKVSMPVWSREGRHLAYVATSNGKSSMILDGTPGPEFDAIVSLIPEFDRSGNHLTYAIRRAGKQCVIIDGQVSIGHDRVSYVTFSQDGKRFAYATEDNGRSCMIVDSQAQKSYAQIGDPFFSPDGKHLAYSASNSHGFWQAGQFIVVDGLEDPSYDSVTIPDLRTNGTIMYAAVKDKVNYYSINGTPHAITGAMVGDPLLCGNHLAYQATLGKKGFAVLDGKVSPMYDDIASIQFSPDGVDWAYSAKTGNTWQIIFNGRAGPAYDLVLYNVVFSQNSRHWAYWATNQNKQFVVSDGKPGPKYDLSPSYSRLIYSRDGEHQAYVACRNRKEVMVVDGREEAAVDGLIRDQPLLPLFDSYYDIPPFFTGDDMHIIYTEETNAKAWVLVDDEMGPKEQLIFCGPRIRPDGKLEYLAAVGPNGICRVLVTLPEK
jgi:hypothetical protein